ncbi:hypothetical protein V2O64_25725 (plasmid) [Verrucomicrobiaceae bacterium 227]
MKIRYLTGLPAMLVTSMVLPAGAETLDSLAEFGNAATADATSGAGTPRGANFDNAAAGAYTITAGGTDIWGNSDNGTFIYDADGTRAAGENFSAIVRSVSVAGNLDEALAGEWGRTGVMARKTPDSANSATVAHVRKSGGNGTTVNQGRPNDGAGTDRGPGNNGEHGNGAANTANGSVRNTPIWLGLHRFNGEWYSTWAPDNAGAPGEWSAAIQRAGSSDMAGEVWVGLAHQSHNINPVINTAVFEEFSVEAFNADFGVFSSTVNCDVDINTSGVFLTVLNTEMGATGPQDIDWEVRYISSARERETGLLNADIYLTANGGSISAFETYKANQLPNGSTQIEQIHWAANAYTTTNAAGTNLFAEAVPGSFAGDQGNYAVEMTGQIHIPSDADRDGKESISFHDGVDDFVYLAIDGIQLIEDNLWSNVAGTGNNGGTLVTMDVSDAKFDDGEWVDFRMVTWETGGGDDAILVWDALDRTGSDSVTGGVDAAQNSYLGATLADGAQVSFAHDFSDKIPAENFSITKPIILDTVSGTGQPDSQAINALPVGTSHLEIYANGELCHTAPAIVSLVNADFTSSNVLEMVLADVGSGGVSDLDDSTVTATLDGVSVAPVITRDGGLVTVAYTFPAPPTPYTLYDFSVSGTSTAATGSVPLEYSVTRRSFPILDELRAGLAAPPNASVGWDYMEFIVPTTLGRSLGATDQGFIDAQTVISTAVAPDAQAQQPYVNHVDPDSNGLTGEWNPDLPILIDNVGVGDDQFVTYARTTVTIAAGDEGDYTFRITGDDGYGLRVNEGAAFTSVAGSAINELDPRDPSVVFHPNFGGNSNAYAVCNFPAAGDYLVEFFGFEGGGGAYQEVSWAKGAFTNLSQSAAWALLGDSSELISVSRWGELAGSVLPPAPTVDAPGWSTYLYYGVGGNFGSLANTMNYLRNTADPGLAVVATLPALNHSDDGVNAGRINPTEAFPGDPNVGAGTDNIGMIARGFVVAPVSGNYTLQVRSDDGFLLRWANPLTTFSAIDGAGSLHGSALNEVFFPDGTGDSNTRAPVFLTAGVHELHFIWWEGGGGAHFEVSSAPGIELSQDGPYELLSTTPSATNLYVGAGSTPDIVITEIAYDKVDDTYSLSFNSLSGATYKVMADTDLMGFEQEVMTNIPGNGAMVNFGPIKSPFPGAPKVFFRVELE